LLVKKTPAYYAVVNVAKGGVVKAFNEDGPVLSDTGMIARAENGKSLVSHLVGDYDADVDPQAGRVTVRGKLAWRKHQVSSPPKQIAFRTVNMTVGRLSANALRSTLQKVLITGKPFTNIRFQRDIDLTDDDIVIRDKIDMAGSNIKIDKVMVGSDATSIYVANSNTFQESVLLPWIDVPDAVDQLRRAGEANLPERHLGEQKLGE
jgi:hypothetical protein